MRFVRTLAAASVAFTFATGMTGAQAQSPARDFALAQTKQSAAPVSRHTGTQVYLLRGFMDIFSTGMDDLGSKLSRRGIRAHVYNHSEYQTLAAQIIDRHRRGLRENVVIIGHSLGGNDAFPMAELLGQAGITVPLIITFDPTASMSAPRNVSRVVNFYSSTNGWGAPIERGAGFRGSLSNVDLSRRGEVGHTDIDKSPALHAQSIAFVQSIGGGGRSSTATAPDKGSSAPSGARESTKEAAKEAAPEKTASTPAKSADEGKPAADAKPAAEKTETAASPAETPKTNN
jgi:pimeloyl-ACP methyl ester carboxylesterase